MISLSETLPLDEYQRFLQYFSIRRTSEKFWSGVWTDMSIEQVLMRALKAQGGLTRGRGLTDSVLAKWVSAMPECSKISDAAETFTGSKTTFSEQHVELRDSREVRDLRDINKLLEWLQIHSPFDVTTTELVSLSSGVIATKEINCDSVVEKGEGIMEEHIGQNFGEIRLKRSNKVKNLSFINKTVSLYNQTASVNPSVLFNRIICTYKSKDELTKCFSYDLSPYPLALFEKGCLRKTTKSTLYKIFDKKCVPTNTPPDDTYFVIDGGYLIHKVVWQFPTTYEEIYKQFFKYIVYHYGKNSTIVFDSYDSNLTTKEQEQIRRYQKVSCPDLHFSESTRTTVSQSTFFSNKINKQRFILQLSKHLEKSGVSVLHAEGDADNLIVDTSIELRNTQNSVTLVGEDTDLMVLLIFKVKKEKIYMLRPGSSAKPDKLTEIVKLQEKLGSMTKHILFSHAISGCDTTSALFKKGKLTCFKLLEKREDLQQRVDIFLKPKANTDLIMQAGEEFLLAFYGAKKSCKSLDNLRYIKYTTTTGRQGLNKNFELASLPPTSDSAAYHFKRVYFQIQSWIGNSTMSPTEWGWKQQNNTLKPVTTDKAIAPDFILKLVFCNCKTDCRNLCSCRKATMNCSSLCGQCQGNSCSNIYKEEDSLEDEF